MDLLEFLKFGFVQRAFAAGVFLALSSALLGLFLILRKMAMIGDGISHISFGAIAVGLFFGIYPFYAALPLVLLASLFILKLSKKSGLFSDAAIAILSSVGLAGGVLISSLARGFNIDLMSYLFGNILTVSSGELLLAAATALLVISFILFFYRELFAITFDQDHARTLTGKVELLNTAFTLLTALNVLLLIRLVGALLVSALLILPAATALQLGRRFRGTIIITGVLAVFSVVGGLTLSLLLNLPSGATIVLFSFFIFLLSLLFRKIYRPPA